MEERPLHILTVNAGASSLKFALFTALPRPLRVLQGKIERIGLPRARLATSRAEGATQVSEVAAPNQSSAVSLLLAWLASTPEGRHLGAVGHRVVHGGSRYREPCIVTAQVRAELSRLALIDPEHLPFEIELLDAIARARPELPQVACFDTAFHHD